MNPVMQKLRQWTRRASHAPQKPDADPIAYRICGWPELHDSMRTAAVYRLLSTMSVRAVSRSWMLWNSQLAGDQVDRFLQTLQRQRLLQARTSPAAAGEPAAGERMAGQAAQII